VRVFYPNGPLLHAEYSPGRVAELEDVALEALDGEVLVNGADECVLRLQDDAEVCIVRDRAAGGDRQHARAAAALDLSIDGVEVYQRATPSSTGREALRQHFNDFVELRPGKVPVGIGSANQLEHVVQVPVFPRSLGYDLLRQHIEGLVANDQPVELSASDRVEQGRTLDQLIAAQGKEAALWRAVDSVS
jgi:hypothetical protein